MRIHAIDPGPEQSARVIFDGAAVVRHELRRNDELRALLLQERRAPDDVLVLEQIAAMGMAVGADVFETVLWSGRLIEAWTGPADTWPWGRVKRHEVKSHLCGSQRAKDPNIRQALIDRFGPGKTRAIGTKAAPGPLYGIVHDEWSALAVAVVWWDRAQPAQRRRA